MNQTIKRQRAEMFLKQAGGESERVRASSEELDEWYSVSSSIESFWLMRLGAMVGFLDYAEIDEIFGQTATKLRSNYEAFRPLWGDLIHFEVRGDLETAFASKVLSGPWKYEDRFWPVFQNIALTQCRIDQSEALRDFILAVDFLDEQRWNRLFEKELDDKDVINCMETETCWQHPPDVNSVVAGCCVAIEEMIRLTNFLSDDAAFPGIERDGWGWIRTKAARAFRWRFPWDDSSRRRRFLRIVELVDRKLAEDLERPGFNDLSGSRLVEAIDESIVPWVTFLEDTGASMKGVQTG